MSPGGFAKCPRFYVPLTLTLTHRDGDMQARGHIRTTLWKKEIDHPEIFSIVDRNFCISRIPSLGPTSRHLLFLTRPCFLLNVLCLQLSASIVTCDLMTCGWNSCRRIQKNVNCVIRPEAIPRGRRDVTNPRTIRNPWRMGGEAAQRIDYSKHYTVLKIKCAAKGSGVTSLLV